MTIEEHKKNIEEGLESVNDFVFIKEYVGGFDGCHLAAVGERSDLKAVRNCLRAMYDYINALEEKRLDDPLGMDEFFKKK